jgi:hypothetical protein
MANEQSSHPEAVEVRSHKARSSVYWLPNLEDQASERILEALNEIPLTQADLRSKLRSLLIGWPQTERDEMLARLIKEKRVYKVPPLTGKAALLSSRAEATPQDYVRLALQLPVARLKSRGLTAVQVMTVARGVLQPTPASPEISISHRDAVDLERLILERMLRLNPSAVNQPAENMMRVHFAPPISRMKNSSSDSRTGLTETKRPFTR